MSSLEFRRRGVTVRILDVRYHHGPLDEFESVSYEVEAEADDGIADEIVPATVVEVLSELFPARTDSWNVQVFEHKETLS
jgi:hypothetical protein